MILGTDAAGVDPDGNEVIVHALIGDPDYRGDETFDPSRTLLSEKHQGTFAEQLVVPRRNLVPKPAGLSMAEAACLPTAYLTAYRMLFTRGQLKPGATVLVQGAGGGVATACILLGHAAGLRVWVTQPGRGQAGPGAGAGCGRGIRDRRAAAGQVDAVMETVGEATWGHSMRSMKPGGTIVISGATAGSRRPRT